MNFKVSLQQRIIDNVKSAAGEITRSHLSAAQDFMKDLSYSVYAKAHEMAAQKLHSTRQQYTDALYYDDRSGLEIVIGLHATAAHLETGYDKFDMLQSGLLNGPNVKTSKEGHRYVRVPFEHSQAPAATGHPMNTRPVQIGQIGETTRGNLAKDLKRLKQVFGISGRVDLPSGAPAQGPVWTVGKTAGTPVWTMRDMFGDTRSASITGGRPISKNLVGLTSIQYKAGRSIKTGYMTWRTASEKTLNEWTKTKAGRAGKMRKGTWIHPGFSGAHIFPELERFAKEALDRELRRLFQGA
jgi:hypothetical protein